MNFIKGILIGVSMMIPGLSGGSCAMVLKIYERIMDSICNIINIKNILFIFKIGLGILCGICLFSFALYKFTLNTYFRYLVIFIILINIFMLLKEFSKFKKRYILLCIVSFLSMYSLKNLSTFELDLNLLTYLLIGLILAISLILPGLGGSYVLYILNLYDRLNNALVTFDFLFLTLLSLSTLIGMLLSSNIINKILKKDKFLIYSVVIGLLLGGI